MAEMPPPSFLFIIQLHHLQAMLQLGLLPNPATGKPNPVNMAKAKHELALLEILREKTAGNLDAEEAAVLDEVIGAIQEVVGEA